MLTYRGDKFVRGKKFTINETEYYFSKRDNDKLIFESVKDKTKFTITEEEYNKNEKMLTEKINQENKEINDIIGKVLRSKTLARKYEKQLNDKGITIDYSNPQGVILTGPDGRTLSASSKEVFGPHTPDNAKEKWTKDGYRRQDDAHYQTSEVLDTFYSKHRDEEKKELERLKGMERDDIIRAYPDKTTEEALKAHQELIDRTEQRISDYSNAADNDAKRYKNELINAKNRRRDANISTLRKATPKEKADSAIDYLNYLTKPKNEYMDKVRNYSYKRGYTDRNLRSNSNPMGDLYNSDKENDIDKYRTLKRGVEDAQSDVDRRTASSNVSWHYDEYMTDEELENKIQSMRDDLEAKIEELRKTNTNRGEKRDEYIKKLQTKEKELNDFLKSKGIRESILTIINSRVLKESDSIKEGNESIDELRLHLEDIKSVINNEGSIDKDLLKNKIDVMLNLLGGYKEEMNDSIKEDIEDEENKFSGVDFETNIPHEMRFKEYYKVDDGNTLYWVTQEPFSKEQLNKFAEAFYKTGIPRAAVTVRDFSTYNYDSDKENKVLAYIDAKTKTVDSDDYWNEVIDNGWDSELTESAKLNESLYESNTRAGNDFDKVASYMYNEADGYVDDIPDYEETNDYIASVTKAEYNKLYKMVKQAIENVVDNMYNGKIELSDRATINSLSGNVDDVDPDETLYQYGKLVNEALENFEKEAGTEVWQDGRMGRHIIVDNNYYNARDYNKLCEIQEKWEDWVIDEFAKLYPFKESASIKSQDLKELTDESLTESLETSVLNEKINQENIEVNKKIYDILKKIQRDHNCVLSNEEEQLLKKYKIKRSKYGDTLIGPNGKELQKYNSREIWGPSIPGQNGTHGGGKESRRSGQYEPPGRYPNSPKKSTEIDFLNYLTKPDTGKDFRGNRSNYRYVKNQKGNWVNYDYAQKNYTDTSKSPNIEKYTDMKDELDRAQSHLDWSDKPNKRDYNARIREIEKEYEEEMKDYNNAKAEVKNQEKEIKKFLKDVKNKKNK